MCNISDWRLAIKNQNAVIHLAAETGTGQSMYEVARYNQVNVVGTANLFDVLANESHNVQKILIASSRAIYGEEGISVMILVMYIHLQDLNKD